MKNKVYIVLILLFTLNYGYSQVSCNIKEIQFQGKKINAFTIELSQNLNFVKEVFNKKFEIDNLTSTKLVDKSFITVKQVKLSKVSSSYMDLYYSIEELKNENKDYIRIVLLVSKGYDNFITESSDFITFQNITNLMNEIGISVQRKNLENQIVQKEQELLIEKQKNILFEEELTILELEKKDLEKKIKNNQENLLIQTRITNNLSNVIQQIRADLVNIEKKIFSKK